MSEVEIYRQLRQNKSDFMSLEEYHEQTQHCVESEIEELKNENPRPCILL